MTFELTPKQIAAQKIIASDAKHIMLFGGSRSGKTFLHVRNIVMRALKAPRSRHAILRYRFNAVRNSIAYDTFPKVMELAFPGCKYTLSKSDWYVTLDDVGSEIWFGGLDDKERTEKILGQEYVTIMLNECSQIPYASVLIAQTRLAQRVEQVLTTEHGDVRSILKPRMYYDCNPPTTGHWSYKLWFKHVDPDSKQALANPSDYAYCQLNPVDNSVNISDDYIKTLEAMPARLRRRFLDGEYGDDNPHALFDDPTIDTWRITDGKVPDFVRIVVAVDPSGSGDVDNADNDAIGIIVAGLGIDGNAYLIEDCTVKAGPGTWGRIAASAYERHSADVLVGETNYGGEMVRFTVQTANSRINYKSVTATRGKTVRAEPISALYAKGKVRHVGYFRDLEDELIAFSTFGYTGPGSPNRADAAIWAITELFPGVVKQKREESQEDEDNEYYGWMG